MTRRTIAIIPARGQSQGIPRKNARLLNGMPLLLHVIRAAKRAECIDALYVSTDDPELMELARRSDTPVLKRPPHLAGPEATLDAVVVDAVHSLERSGETMDQVVTLQPTCPLITPRTIDAAIDKCRRERLSTVVTVVNDTHLSWGLDGDRQAIPLYEARVNRQELPPVFRETGAVVVARRDVLEAGSRFGPSVGLLEVSKQESIDIDDNFDWWLADKSLRRRRILFHVVGNQQLGLGHVYRALTLADRLIDHELTFLTSSKSPMAADLIRRRFYPVEVVAPGEEQDFIVSNPPDLLINDVLDTDDDFVEAAQAAGSRVINFEDLGSGSDRADRVINAMLDEHPTRHDQHVYHGPDFCCLRDEFYTIQPTRAGRDVKNVLLMFGGTDPTQLTERYLRWLDRMPQDFRITVIAGVGFSRRQELERIAAVAAHPVELVYDTSVVSRYMAGADLAITSAGRTVFELAALAVPMLVIAHHVREQTHSFAHSNPGAVFLGVADDIDRSLFRRTMHELLSSPLLRAMMNEALQNSGTHRGVHRVLGIIEEVLAGTQGDELCVPSVDRDGAAAPLTMGADGRDAAASPLTMKADGLETDPLPVSILGGSE